jgi:cell wall-associated NlpC family hydrolase
LHTLHDVSPYERIIKFAKSFGSSCLAVAACFLVLCFLNSHTYAQQEVAAGSKPLSCEVKKTGSTKAKPKAPVQPAAKSKATTASKKMVKPAAQPLVSVKTKAKAEAITSEIASDLPSNIEQEIGKFFGLRYRFGGDNQNGFDCSGLVKQVYADVFRVDLPRSSSEISRLGNLQNVMLDELKTGDLVFFGPSRKQVNHVGMYLAGGNFLHAARSEGVTISNLDEHYWKSRFMFSKRMRGIEIAEENDEDLEFERDLMQDSLISAFDGKDAEVRFLDVGIKVNDSLELLLSGFFLNSLEASGPPGPISESTSPSGPEPDESGGGLRLAAIFSPLEWFKLIPSVTQIEGGRDEGRRNQQKLGLETWMILPTSRVAVFMAAHATNQDDLFDRPLGVNPDWQTMDVGIGLHYHLSDSLRFSLWGSYAYNPDAKAFEDSGRRNAALDEMSFQLNFKF